MASDPVDVEAVVLAWAEMMFEATKTKDQGKIPKEALQYKVNWKRVNFRHKEPEFSDKEKPPKPKSQVLFRTYFSNNTEHDQEYSFKTQRVTCSSCEVVMEQCFTVGYEMNVSLKTPGEVFEASAGFHREMSLTNASGQSIEEELSWEVDSQIKVPAKHRTTAELVISEDQFTGLFTLSSEISGKVLVSVTNLKDNNSLVKGIEGNIVEIFKGMRSNVKGLKHFEIEKNVARFVTKGRCNFRYAIEQHVKLDEQAIQDEE